MMVKDSQDMQTNYIFQPRLFQVDAFVDIKRPFIKNLWGVQISYTFRFATISTTFSTLFCFAFSWDCRLSLVLKGVNLF